MTRADGTPHARTAFATAGWVDNSTRSLPRNSMFAGARLRRYALPPAASSTFAPLLLVRPLEIFSCLPTTIGSDNSVRVVCTRRTLRAVRRTAQLPYLRRYSFAIPACLAITHALPYVFTRAPHPHLYARKTSVATLFDPPLPLPRWRIKQ